MAISSSSPTSSLHPNNTSLLLTEQRSQLQAAILSLDHHNPVLINGRKSTTDEQRALYRSLISLCISTSSIHAGRRLRSHLDRTAFPPDLFLDNQFINLYSKCGDVRTARQLFDGMQQRNIVSWNAMISGYSSNAHFISALRLFESMIVTGAPTPDQPTYLSAIRASVGSRNLAHGRQVHARVLKQGMLRSSILLGNAMITMYSKIGQHQDAEAVFGSMPEHDEASWNSLIAANANEIRAQLALFVQMQRAGLIPNAFTFGSLLGSDQIDAIEELHSQIVRRGIWDDVFMGSALLDAYARRGDIDDALLVFDTMPERNNVAWNSGIAACFESGLADRGIRLFLQMGYEGLIPDEYTVSILLKAAAAGRLSAAEGRQIHGIAVRLGSLHTDTLIGNSLIAMFGENKAPSDSWRAFEDIVEPDLITWNSIMQSCVKNERFQQALALFSNSCGLDEFTFVAGLAACASLAWVRTGRAIHCRLIKQGLAPNAFIASALIDMYAKCSAATDAKQVFDDHDTKDMIVWNSMIACLDQNCDLHDVLKLMSRMREEGVHPDNFTFASALAAVAKAASLRHGEQLHGLVLKSELEPDAAVGNALMTMYTRSGSITEAEKAFRRLKDRNVVSWTTMIGGYAQSGCPRLALELFHDMEESGVAPNSKTFVALLTACSYGGLIEEGTEIFAMMVDERYGIKPAYDHYACMVDILGRAGRLKEAEEFILEMPCEPDALVWRMLLSGCRFHGDLERGKRAMERIVELEPGDSASYVLLSNLHAALGKWGDVLEVRQQMRDQGVRKEPGRSQIEVNSRVHEFLAGDCSHPEIDEVCSRLRELFRQMKDDQSSNPFS